VETLAPTNPTPIRITLSGLLNWTVRFALFRAGAFDSCSFHMQTHFGDFAGELNTSSTLSMKGGNSGTNESDPDKDNILKSTFDTLTEEGLKALEDYYANFKEIFLSSCQVTWQGTILWDTTLIVFNKPEVTSEVWPDPSPSRNDVQSMINSMLERKAKSINELLRRLIEEWDRKKLDSTGVNPSSCIVSFTQTNPHTSGTSVRGTIKPNPSA
jgi:hypothetical protein